MNMRRVEGSEEEGDYKELEMDFKFLGKSKVEKVKKSGFCRSRLRLWMLRAITTLLLWACVFQLMALGEIWGPRLLKSWPSCFSHLDMSVAVEVVSTPAKVVLPPKSEYIFN